ncbi:MAG: hypothetical protein Q6352_011670, partial [Candidatus Freyrarchaeum guaymaensis]
MVKELMGLSFEALSSELRAIGCDARTEEAKERGRGAKSPCPSHLHWALKRIPEEYPERALRLIDEMVVEEHAGLFGTGACRSTALTPRGDGCDTLEEAEVAMRTRLHHQTVRYSILVRPVTNTVVAVRVSGNTRDARPLLRHVPPGSTVCMDPEYDAPGTTREYGFERGITLIVRPRLRGGKPYGGRHRSQALREFSWRRYGRRKPCGETYRKQGGPRRGHAELPEARHAEEGTHPQVHSPQPACALHAAGLAGDPAARPGAVGHG